MKGILFLGTSLLGAQYISDVTQAMGYRPIFLLNIDEYSGDPKRVLERYEHYKADVNSLNDILRAIYEHHLADQIVAVTSLLDETLQNACAVAKQFNIVGPDIALNQLTDKAAVRALIPEFSPPSLVIKWANFSETEINQFFAENNHCDEFLLKPGISSGAVGISLLTRTTTAHEIKIIISESKLDGAKQQSWLIQPRITGRLYSLEGFVKSGQVTFLGFSSRTRKELTESTIEFPVDQALPLHLKQKCQEAVSALVQRSSYSNGYFHCEFIINSESAYFIDGNMGRVGGAAIVQQLALVYGKHPVDIYYHVFDLGLFKGMNTQDFTYQKVNDESTLSINYCLSQPATVLNVVAPADLVSFHTKIVDNGREMPAIGASDSAWVGFLAGHKQTVLAEIKQLVVQTKEGSLLPFYMLAEDYSS